MFILVPACAGAVAFPDVPNGYWAADAIENLTARGVLAGYPDGTFRPDEAINRAQIATVLARLRVPQAVKTVEGTQFADVPPDYWAANNIKTAVKLGLITGYPDGTFRPTIPIDRVDAVVMIVRFAALPLDYSLTTYYEDIQPEHWAINYISAALANGFLDFISGDKFEPAKLLTRAEACWLIDRARQKRPSSPQTRRG